MPASDSWDFENEYNYSNCMTHTNVYGKTRKIGSTKMCKDQNRQQRKNHSGWQRIIMSVYMCVCCFCM